MVIEGDINDGKPHNVPVRADYRLPVVLSLLSLLPDIVSLFSPSSVSFCQSFFLMLSVTDKVLK